jgi:hypothetical protein
MGNGLTTSNVFCIWYPSGGFGHFINSLLSLYGENFVRPKKSLNFSTNGNSHDLDLVVPKYIHESWPESFEFIESKNYSVLIDNGINNESANFKSVFPAANVIKICYSDHSWPIVARTSIEKAMGSTLVQDLPTNEWSTNEDWAVREKYFLYLRDHSLRFQWRNSTQEEHTVYVDQMCKYSTLYSAISKIVKVEHFNDVWTHWRNANNRYLAPIEHARTIIDYVKQKKFYDVTHIDDLWTQAVLYYFIQLEFGVEVPHNDYSNWFTNTIDIVKMLDKHGVNH